jgi:comEA protein
MKVLRALHDRFGFTRNEVRAIMLLSGTLVIGSTVRMLRMQEGAPASAFDYSRHDSEFTSLAQSIVKPSVANSDGRRPRQFTRQEPPPAPESINLNTATKTELMRLPGIGQAYAERILEHRRNVNRFRSIEELEQVKGIGKRRLEKIRPYLRIEKD